MPTEQVCSRCKKVFNGSGDLVATSRESRIDALDRKFVAALCPKCFNSLLDWFLEGDPRTKENKAARRFSFLMNAIADSIAEASDEDILEESRGESAEEVRRTLLAAVAKFKEKAQ